MPAGGEPPSPGGILLLAIIVSRLYIFVFKLSNLLESIINSRIILGVGEPIQHLILCEIHILDFYN